MLKLATKSERLRWARINAGFPSAAQAARRLGVPYGTYAGHENGLRGVKESELARYAKAFGVTVAWLVYGYEEEELDKQLICSFGHAGIAPEGEIQLVIEGFYGNWLTYPRLTDTPSAYIFVSGNMARGIAEVGWQIIIERDFVEITEEHIGCLCVCKLKDGRYFIRTPQHSRKYNRYDLEGPMFETMRNQILESVSPVVFIITTRAMREIRKLNKDKLEIFSQGIIFDE